jgi:hypothetical protein
MLYLLQDESYYQVVAHLKMNFQKRIHSIQKWIDHEGYLEDIQFDKQRLFELNYLNFQIDDCYDYMERVEGEIRNDIFKVLYLTYSNWKKELINLEIPFYLGVWIYDPRLPKSEVVCAIGIENIEYYQCKCFDPAIQQKEIIDLLEFNNRNDVLKWKQKIDFEILEEWQVNFPKENYENVDLWRKDQNYYSDFIKNSYKMTNSKRGKVYFKIVGDIWTGEIINN